MTEISKLLVKENKTKDDMLKIKNAQADKDIEEEKNRPYRH